VAVLKHLVIISSCVCYFSTIFSPLLTKLLCGKDPLLLGIVESHKFWTFPSYQLNAQFLYSSTICMLHYDPQHVSSSALLILRRMNCITTASGIVTLCKQPYSMQVESGLVRSQPAYSTALYRE